MRFKVGFTANAIKCRNVRVICAYASLLGAFVFSIVLSLSDTCKKLYLHIHIMVFVITFCVESIIRFYVEKKTNTVSNKGVFVCAVSRVVSMITWHITLLLFADQALINSCISYVVLMTLFCLFFFLYSIHEVTSYLHTRAVHDDGSKL